jgi:NAD(P)-dependent dehydrogenase (short-subunit alcohol dehydrogenase family)
VIADEGARRVVITGSASGIGLATRRRVERSGGLVIGVDRRDAEIEVDLADADARGAAVESILSKAASAIDSVIVCAGTGEPEPATVSVNYFGAVEILEGLRPLLASGVQPRAVVVLSMAIVHEADADIVDACLRGLEPAARSAAAGKGSLIYRSSKRALARWVRRAAITHAWAGHGIALNGVAPGVVRTPMTAGLLDDPVQVARLRQDTPMPLGGPAEPDQIAGVLEWLASPACSMVTGQCLFVDGGSDAVLRGDDVWNRL